MRRMTPSSASGCCGKGCAARYGTPIMDAPERPNKNKKNAPTNPTGPAMPAASTTPSRSSVAGSYKGGVTNTAMAVMLATKMTGVVIREAGLRLRHPQPCLPDDL